MLDSDDDIGYLRSMLREGAIEEGTKSDRTAKTGKGNVTSMIAYCAQRVAELYSKGCTDAASNYRIKLNELVRQEQKISWPEVPNFSYAVIGCFKRGLGILRPGRRQSDEPLE